MLFVNSSFTIYFRVNKSAVNYLGLFYRLFQEEFLDITELDGDFNVVIWTIVDGQLIAKNSVSTQTTHRLESILNARYTETDNIR